MPDETETHADWSCDNCDTTNQLFLAKDPNGWWKPTLEAHNMLEYHLGMWKHFEPPPLEPAQPRDPYASIDVEDLTMRLAAADTIRGRQTGDGPADPDYIKFLARTVLAFKPQEAPPAERSLLARHVPEPHPVGALCRWCRTEWPCEVRRTVDEALAQ